MFKFTIREAILMTTIVAVLLMWWMERSQNVKYEARLETRLQAFPGTFVPVIPAMPRPPIAGSFGPTIPAAPTTPQTGGSNNVTIPAATQPTVKRATIYPTAPSLTPETGQLIPRIETLQKSIQDSN